MFSDRTGAAAAKRDNHRALKRAKKEIIMLDGVAEDVEESNRQRGADADVDEVVVIEVVVIEDDNFLARREEKDLRLEFRKILLRTEDGMTGSLGRCVWAYLDMRSRFSVRMVDKNRHSLSMDSGGSKQSWHGTVRFLNYSASMTLTTAEFKLFAGARPDEQTPAELIAHLSHAGLDLVGERFFPAKNAAYVLRSPFTDADYIRLTPFQTRLDLLGALRQEPGSSEEGITVLVVGPIPTSFIPSINNKEAEMQSRWGFYKDLYQSDLTTAANTRLHADAIKSTIAISNAAYNARAAPVRWPSQFTSWLNIEAIDQEPPIVIGDD